MAVKKYYGIRFPFSTSNDEEIYLDLDESYKDSIKSRVLHVLFTPKGQRLRDPNFGTDLIKYLFEPADDETLNRLKESIREDIKRYVPGVEFDDISIYYKDDNSRIVVIHYSVVKGNTIEKSSVAVKI